MATTRLYTADDLWQMDAGGRFYIIDGELTEDVSAPMSSRTAMRLGGFLFMHIEPRALGSLLGADGAYVLRTDPDTVLIPDLSFVRAERMPPAAEQVKFFRFAPDLAVEVLSPGNRRADVERKVAIYRASGVPLAWVVDPFRQTVTVYTPDAEPRTLGREQTLDGGAVLPGFTLPLTELFA